MQFATSRIADVAIDLLGLCAAIARTTALIEKRGLSGCTNELNMTFAFYSDARHRIRANLRAGTGRNNDEEAHHARDERDEDGALASQDRFDEDARNARDGDANPSRGIDTCRNAKYEGNARYGGIARHGAALSRYHDDRARRREHGKDGFGHHLDSRCSRVTVAKANVR